MLELEKPHKGQLPGKMFSFNKHCLKTSLPLRSSLSKREDKDKQRQRDRPHGTLVQGSDSTDEGVLSSVLEVRM